MTQVDNDNSTSTQGEHNGALKGTVNLPLEKVEADRGGTGNSPPPPRQKTSIGYGDDDFKQRKYEAAKARAEKRISETRRKHGIINLARLRLRLNVSNTEYAILLERAKQLSPLFDGLQVTTLCGRKASDSTRVFSLMEKFATDLVETFAVHNSASMQGKTIAMMLLLRNERKGNVGATVDWSTMLHAGTG